ncbi:MAG: hypothetical protein MUF24_11275 [Chitinophagaceae bacterium]|jgi:hypothetical protein|nr:hypothetical protein [Chitinophagaceae bacterium]
MAINKNHLFEELNGIKCALVEAQATPERVRFLTPLLQHNGYTVVVVPAAPPKSSKPADPAAPADSIAAETPPQLYTIGVTDVMFNPTNAIFGRFLKTPEGHVVTLAYWQQKEAISQEEKPYFSK